MLHRGKTFWFVALLPLLVGFDYGTKEAARTLPLGGEVQLVPGWLSLLHTQNGGVICTTVPTPDAVIVGGVCLVMAAMLWAFWRLPRDARLRAAALAAMMSGALGNLVDRLGDGNVTDFVRMYAGHEPLRGWLVERFGTSTWPIYNVADVCILAGAALWMIASAAEQGAPLAEEAA
jgi:signal peptidase II